MAIYLLSSNGMTDLKGSRAAHSGGSQLFNRTSLLAPIIAIALATNAPLASAAGGYFALGYGPIARQMAGATTALADDAFAGASNPAKFLAAGDRLDLGAELFMPYRRIERVGSGTPYDFSSTSKNSLFLIPEGAYSHRLNERLAWGVTLYGNGGLNTEYKGTTGVPGTNFNPALCGDLPANFLLGCGKLGFDLMQLVIAPGLAYRVTPGHTFGIAPLIGLQLFQAYGLQAFAPLSKLPHDVTNRGTDATFGAGARLGWLGQITPTITLGAAYATRVYMQRSEKYEGLFADGRFDIPENFSLGLALKPTPRWTTTFDFQRISYGGVNALSNGVLNSLLDPANKPLGSSRGSGFNWRDQNNYRAGLAFAVTPTLTVRGGYAYGQLPNDEGINSVTFNMLAPNSRHQASVGFSWRPKPAHELHFACGHFFRGTYRGPSATEFLGIGGEERVTSYVNTLMVAWSWLR